jgi:pyridoxamine 5'-phosphate oxidase
VPITSDNWPLTEWPLEEALAPWRSPLARALHRNRSVPFARYLQLATVRADATPANRTVVFRGFLAGTNGLMFVSDRRSEKIAQIQQNPQAEACWYFTQTREQFRLAGRLIVVSAETEQSLLANARQDLWQHLSDSARLQFAWPQPKGKREAITSFNPPAPEVQRPPLTFCLLCLAVNRVDHLELRGEPQNRCLYEKINQATPGNSANQSPAQSEPAQDWKTTLVNP